MGALLCACGGKAAPNGAQVSNLGHGGGADQVAVALGPFNDVFAPLWAEPAGPQRFADTCAAQPDLKAASAALRAAATPDGLDEVAWTKHTWALDVDVDYIKNKCDTHKPDDFEESFAATNMELRALEDLSQGH